MHVVWNIINELHEILFMVLKPLNLQSYKIEKPPKNEEWRMLFSEQHSNDNIVRKCVRWATETHWLWKHHLPLSERQRLLPAWPWCCCWNITCWYAGMRNTVKYIARHLVTNALMVVNTVQWFTGTIFSSKTFKNSKLLPK